MKKLAYHFHTEKEHNRMQCFGQGFFHLSLSGITKFKYGTHTKKWIMDSGGEVKCQG